VIVCAELEDAIKKVQNEEIRIPFGVGIAGSVAQTKEVINITSAYEVRGQTFFAKTYIMASFSKSFSAPTCPQDGAIYKLLKAGQSAPWCLFVHLLIFGSRNIKVGCATFVPFMTNYIICTNYLSHYSWEALLHLL